MLAFLRRQLRCSGLGSPKGSRSEVSAEISELLELRTQLAEERSRVRILTLEQETLLDVIERDRKRVAAETQNFAAAIVDAERKVAQGGGE